MVHDIPVNTDRQALTQLVEGLRASPQPPGLIARLRHNTMIRRAERALEWLDDRTESKAQFIWWRSRLPASALGMYAVTIVPAILFDPFMPSRTLLLALSGAAALLLGGLGGRAQWDANERNCAVLLHQARPLLHQAQRLPLGARDAGEDS